MLYSIEKQDREASDMVQITKENGMQSAGVPFAWVEVQYPDKVQWDEAGF